MNPRRFVNRYNREKPHKGIGNLTPGEKLLEYLYPETLYTKLRFVQMMADRPA